MTNSEWSKKVRALKRTGEVTLKDGCVLQRHFNNVYSLYASDGNCITVEWNLDRIKELVVD